MAEIPFEPYTGQGKFRFWCQKVLPLVYDDSLSYYELLGKVVEYLNNTIKDVSACEDNITALRDAFVQLQEYVNEMLDDFAPEIERIIDEMIDSGEFGEIISDVVNGLIASEYDESTQYLQFAYCLKDGKLYCATASTTGTWDETKWRETTVGYDMQLLSRRLYNLNAGQVSYDNTATYDNGTVGKKLKDLDDFDTNLNAGQVGYNSESTYNNATVGKELQELKGSLNAIGNLRFVSFDTTSITAQVDALGVGAFWGTVGSNTVGMPTTGAGIVRVLSYNAYMKRIYFYPNGSDDAEYMLEKRTSWRSWITLPTRAEVDEIRNAEIPTEVTISSVHENVTINSQKVYQTGRIVVVAINITISQDITTSAQLLYGFPAPIALTAFAAITDGDAHGCNIRSNRYLYNDGAITAGSWYINVTYITAS